MKGVHLIEDNIHIRIWSFDSIDYKYEHTCINFLSPTHNLSMDEKSKVFPCAYLKSLLLHSTTFVWKKDSYTFHTLHWWNLKDLEEVDLTHCIRGINVGFIWRVTKLSLYTHWRKTGWQWVLIIWRHPPLSSSIWLSNGSNTWTNSSKVVVFILSTMCEIIFTSKC